MGYRSNTLQSLPSWALLSSLKLQALLCLRVGPLYAQEFQISVLSLPSVEKVITFCKIVTATGFPTHAAAPRTEGSGTSLALKVVVVRVEVEETQYVKSAIKTMSC